MLAQKRIFQHEQSKKTAAKLKHKLENALLAKIKSISSTSLLAICCRKFVLKRDFFWNLLLIESC